MQFSTSYRLITGDRGNLYREMQMFKRYVKKPLITSDFHIVNHGCRFDARNNGTLTEEDWVDGWLGMVKEAEFAKTLARIHALADDLQ
jgi:hypothetical protein